MQTFRGSGLLGKSRETEGPAEPKYTPLARLGQGRGVGGASPLLRVLNQWFSTLALLKLTWVVSKKISTKVPS